MSEMPRVLIEDWFPIDVIGAESMRERGASSALPPLYFLHVWWARRPLTASRAAILASVLPVWAPDWPQPLLEKFPDEARYRQWFLELCGVFGNPVEARKLLAAARARGEFIPNPNTARRAYTVSPSAEYLATLGDLLQHAWGRRDLAVLDPFAGGGSIPFEALRYGFRTYANELNPVASVILKATLDYPFRFGLPLARDIEKYGNLLAERVRKRMEPYFSPLLPEDRAALGVCYLWARTVNCPYTGKPIPLSPNWWLRKDDNPVAVRPIFDAKAAEARFEIVSGKRQCAAADPDRGTVRRGDAVSPWADNQAVDGDYIKAEAQAGRMGQQLYALAVKKDRGFAFRAPSDADLKAAASAGAELARRLPAWDARGWVPREPRLEGRADWSARVYGIETWMATYGPRQLLAMLTIQEAYHEVLDSLADSESSVALATLLALAFDKAADYNSCQVSWHPSRQVIAHAFTRHDLSFRWSYAEFDASRNLVPWVVEQVSDAFAGICRLAQPEGRRPDGDLTTGPAFVRLGNACDLDDLVDGSIDLICVDPPYYDNVSYAECSNYFYVWMKRLLGARFEAYRPWFAAELADAENEAVANFTRFADYGKRRKDLAVADYERKMLAAFKEMNRVLSPQGVLTVMFTHKEVRAWDTLARALIGAGFAIESSWPVHTESEHSLHQARKNAAQSTILLTCRRRKLSHGHVWWEDLKGRVRETARSRAEAFEAQGIRGVDLYIATFGPTLRILSENWPVLTAETDERGDPLLLRPDAALDLAREEVISLRKRGLLLGRTVRFDPLTDWYLLAWDTFRAEEFPADEARKLAIALGLDLEKQIVAAKKVVGKKASSVILRQPAERRGAANVDPDRLSFDCILDAVHTAMLLYQEDGARACRAFLDRAGLREDTALKSLVQALVNAIPRVRDRKGGLARPEARILEEMRLAFWQDIQVPDDDDLPPAEMEQMEMYE